MLQLGKLPPETIVQISGPEWRCLRQQKDQKKRVEIEMEREAFTVAGEYVLQVSEPKFSDLSLSFCGYADCQPGYSFGPAVRPNYIIHYILNGKGTFQIGDSVYPLKKGEGFLIEPDVLTYYQADQNDPWTYLWVGFTGKNAEQ